MNFATQYSSERIRKFTDAGDPVKITYGGRYDENGRVVLEEKGRENLYAFIQSHKESVDINYILARFTNGETDALTKVQGFYGDVTSFPSNYADALNRIQECEEMFRTLPVETRAKFNHSFSEFLASTGSADFMEKLGLIQNEPVASPAEKPIKEDKPE